MSAHWRMESNNKHLPHQRSPASRLMVQAQAQAPGLAQVRVRVQVSCYRFCFCRKNIQPFVSIRRQTRLESVDPCFLHRRRRVSKLIIKPMGPLRVLTLLTP
jgi:hypothetical protein